MFLIRCIFILFSCLVFCSYSEKAKDQKIVNDTYNLNDIFDDEDLEEFGRERENNFVIGVSGSVLMSFFDFEDHVSVRYKHFRINQNYSQYVLELPVAISLGWDSKKLGCLSFQYFVNPFDMNSVKAITQPFTNTRDASKDNITGLPNVNSIGLFYDQSKKLVVDSTLNNNSNAIKQVIYHLKAQQAGMTQFQKQLNIKHTHKLGLQWRSPDIINFTDDFSMNLLLQGYLGFANIFIDHLGEKKYTAAIAELSLMELIVGGGIGFKYQIEDIAKICADFYVQGICSQWYKNQKDSYKHISNTKLPIPYVEYLTEKQNEVVDVELAKRKSFMFGMSLGIYFSF